MRNQQVEDWLQQQGFTEGSDYIYDDSLALSRIDERSSLANQARLANPVDQDWVFSYARRIEEGSTPPPIVAVRQRNGQLLVIDGNHRYLALKKVGVQSTSAYILNLIEDTEILGRLIAMANASLVGRGASMEDLISKAADLVISSRKPIKAVAESYNVSYDSLRYRVRVRQAMARANALGFDSRKLHESVLARLADIPNDAAMLAFMGVCQRANLKRKEIHPVITEIRDQRTEAAMLDVVQRFRERPDIKRREQRGVAGLQRGREGIRRGRLLSSLSTITSILQANQTRGALELSADEDYEKARTLASEAATLLRLAFGLS